MTDALSITVNPEHCRGCRRCQVACSSHDPGPLNPRHAGIQIMKLDEGGCDYPVMNMECLEKFCGKTDPRNKTKLEPACVSACLFGGLQVNRKDGENE